MKFSAMVVILSLGICNAAHAQAEFYASPTPVHFAAGQDSAVITGAIVQGEVECFTLVANAGQKATVSIQSDGNIAVFQFYQTGWKVGTDDGDPVILGTAYSGAADGDDAQNWSGAIAKSGKSLITVGSTAGDTAYKLTIVIKPKQN
jgi:hypothetical protein